LGGFQEEFFAKWVIAQVEIEEANFFGGGKEAVRFSRRRAERRERKAKEGCGRNIFGERGESRK
jgi:hypothetical protein